jgi:hypothetical protein
LDRITFTIECGEHHCERVCGPAHVVSGLHHVVAPVGSDDLRDGVAAGECGQAGSEVVTLGG